MFIRLIQQKVPLGSEISIYNKAGQLFRRGVLTGLTESYLMLRDAEGQEVFIVEEMIGSFEGHQSSATAATSPSTPVPLPAPAAIPPAISAQPPALPIDSNISANAPAEALRPSTISSTALPADLPISASVDYPEEVRTRALEIGIEFRTALPQARLEPLPIVLNLPTEIIELPFGQKRTQMQGGWDKIQNAYKYYRDKDKSLSRLNPIIENCKQFIRKYPEISIARYNLGCLYLEAQQRHEALRTFKEAAILTQLPQAFYNWAVAALQKRDEAQACYALQQFFRQTSLAETPQAWYVCLRLAQQCQTLTVLPELYELALEDGREADARLLLKSAIYVLKSNSLVEEAHSLAAELLHSDLTLTAAQLTEQLAKLQLTPTEAYRAQQQVIQNTRQTLETERQREDIEGRIRMLLNNAEHMARQQKYNLAIAEARKAEQLDRDHTQVKQKLAEYRDAAREQALPNDDSPYAQAKYAKDHEKNTKKAERLFREAIRQGDRVESAIKDLAALLREASRTNEAIELLLTHRERIVDNKQSLSNLLSDMYQHSGRYEEAIACLEDILKNTSHERRPNVQKRIALCQGRLKEYDAAEATLNRVLAQSPNDEVALRWLEGIRQAKLTGRYDDLDEFFLAQAQDALPDAGSSLSGFLNFHLERCEYEGLEASKVASRDFTVRDADKLQDLAKRLGIKRPRERANYFLSAAKILMEQKQQAEEVRPNIYLRNFCAAMGDACVAEQKHPDVIRSYYAEAFLVAPDWVDQLEVKLSQFVMLYCYSREELLKFDLPSLETCLEQALSIPKLATQVIEGLWQLSWFHREVGRFLIRSVHDNKALRERIQSLCYGLLGEVSQPTDDQETFLELWEKGRVRMRGLHQEITDELNYLYSAASSLDTLPDQIARVQRLRSKMRAALDQQRLQEIREILNSMTNYSQQQEYGEREYYENIIRNRVSQSTREIEENPTEYSLELFRPYLLALGRAIEGHFSEIQRATEPNALKIELAIDSYPNDGAIVECQVTISNERGKSPASAIKIYVQDSPDGDYQPQQRDINVTEALAGGQSVTCIIPLKVSGKAQQSEAFTLYYQLSYITRIESRTQSGTLAIRCHSATDFNEIANPYASYAEGKVVEDEQMFYGRDQILAYLLSAIRDNLSTKSFVIYGQKRTGKSSVLYHLKQQLHFPIIPVSFSLGQIIVNFSITDFLYRIIQRIEEEFEKLADAGYPSITISRPRFEELEKNPQLRFQDYMTDLQRCLRREAVYREARIILLIDEFSYIYTQIKRGHMTDTFMKFWKALLEQGYFGSVLVGQDVMPKFIEEFPNEFQVASQIRVSYLDATDARKLISDPIRIAGTDESRYRGNAVNRLLELTAGNPYYIQIFCDRLVKYMNRKKAMYVTDADIDQVKLDLLSGNSSSLKLHQFDNLISASDNDVDEINQEDSKAVLRAIAVGSRIQDDCDRSTIDVATSIPVDVILNDLWKREVIDKKKETLFQIRVKLFKEWLLAN